MSRNVRALRRSRRLIGLLLLGSLCGCARQHRVAVQNAPLIVAPSATEIRRTPEYDGATHYVVEDPYPGEVTIAYIDSAMSKAGWQASDRSLLRLDRTDGGRTWWSHHKQPDTKIYQWDAGWSNDSGNLVTYLLRYEVSPPNAVARRLLVSAVYTKAATVKKMREELRIK